MTDLQIIQAAAITEANNRTSEAGLPTYSELVEALRKVEMNTDRSQISQVQGGIARAILARIPA